MMNFTRRILGVLALLVLTGLLAGVPLLLWWITAPLLPTGLPSLTQILAALTALTQ